MKVLNFGSLNLDYVYQVDHLVLPKETISASEQMINAGGKGLNQSVSLARADCEVYHAGCVGKGGDMLKDLLNDNGVNTEYLQSVDTIQGNAMIQVDRYGENCIVLFGGSNQCISEEQIKETLSHFEKGDYLVLQNEINHLDRIIEMAYEKGMIIVLNPSPFNRIITGLDLNKVDWLLMNEVETEQLSGCSDPDEAWTAIHRKYPQISAVITLGKQGSRAYCSDGEKANQKAFTVNAVDTTAAGDTFTGYFISSLISGYDLQKALERASAASAISVTRNGAAASIPLYHEVEEFLSNH